MSVEFAVLSAAIVVPTATALTRSNPVHAIVWLVVSFLGTALLFYRLGAPLLAALEMIVYAGAIMVLFLFVVMTMETDRPKPRRIRQRRWWAPFALGGFSAAASGFLVFSGPDAGLEIKALPIAPIDLGAHLFRNYWFAVEIVSLLLFVALVGALYLGRSDGKGADSREGGDP